MRHRVSGKKIGRDIKQRKALFRNLVASLISYGRIKTTEVKAKAVRGLVDKLVTKAKQGSLHSKRQVLSFFSRKEVAKKLFLEIVPRFKRRKGGFTRITSIGQRRGDNTPMVLVEWAIENEKIKMKNAKLKKEKRKFHDQDKTNKSKRD